MQRFNQMSEMGKLAFRKSPLMNGRNGPILMKKSMVYTRRSDL